MTHSAIITGIRLTHNRVTQSELEVASYSDPTDRLDTLCDKPGITEAFILQTCNRIEEYVVTDSSVDRSSIFSDVSYHEAAVTTDHTESLRHLLRVGAGLESQVLGEDQILGQLRTAYHTADEANALGPILEPAVLKAIHVGERARTDTTINEGIVSLGEAAVTLAEQHHDTETASVLIIGAGEMASLAATAIARQSPAITIANRSIERARNLAAELDATTNCYSLDSLPLLLERADIVITATGSETPIIDTTTIRNAGQTTIIDIAQPRDVAAELDSEKIRVYDLDGLQTITEKTHESRAEAATKVEQIIDEELELLLDFYKRHRADIVIKAMYAGADRIKQRELERALAELDISEGQEEIIASLADAITGKLMAVPTQQLREAASEDDWETIHAAIELFEPSFDAEFTDSSRIDVPENASSNS